jgi:glutamate carboxypeptidase
MRRFRSSGLLCLVALVVFWGGRPGRADLDEPEQALRDRVYERRPAMVETLKRWVEINTGTWNVEGLERFASILGAELAELGFEVRIKDGVALELPERGNARTGPLVVARRDPSPRTEAAPRLLLIGHLDTVFEADSPFQTFRLDPEDSNRAYGPGVVDMKGGLVVLVEALRALRESGDLDQASTLVLLNSDEEVGSLGSRARVEVEAQAADCGFVFEPAQSSGALVRSRRGLGQFHLRVEGIASHAGSAHRDGRSAIRELAEKVVRLEKLSDYERGVTLNVGTIRGGTKRNIVPDRAEAWIDVRYDTPELGAEIKVAVEEIARTTFVEGTRTHLWGTLHRPPKVATEQVDALLDLHGEVARDLGLMIPSPLHSGGGTDGSLTGAQGLPTLDSMGPIGGASHTEREFVQIPSLPERAALTALFLRRLIRRGSQGCEGDGSSEFVCFTPPCPEG